MPATVGVLDGVIRVGLQPAELERFAEAGTSARKAGARDLAACVVQGALGSTTVGGTLAVCRVAGIRFMGTGGIGGVHRGFAQTLDVSADLPQLARTPAMVVCSGAKSILDVSATSELLETLGVPVLGWQTSTLPMFYTGQGGPPVSAEVTGASEAARIAAAHWQLSRDSGLILGRPPADGLDIEALISEAVEQVRSAGVTGQAVTPAVLTAIEELSGGAQRGGEPAADRRQRGARRADRGRLRRPLVRDRRRVVLDADRQVIGGAPGQLGVGDAMRAQRGQRPAG